MKDFIFEYPVYNNWMFEQRFQMSKHLFLQLIQDLQAYDQFWILKAVIHFSLFFFFTIKI
jgi:hypothetical protein